MPVRVTAQKLPQVRVFNAVGISASLDKAEAMKAVGAEFLTESVGDFLMPEKPDAEFDVNLGRLKLSPLPILACNGFLRPANFHCVGPDANHQPILEWSEIAFRRLKQADGKFIVFGSGSARQIPDGWSREKARQQFVTLLKAMGELAKKLGVTVIIEQLQERECNFINRIIEGAEIVRAVAHPKVRLLADLYHMAAMGDTPEDLKRSMDVISHMEIAEKSARSVPGVAGDDFRPYFRVVRESGYQGAISIEGNYTDEQLAPAFKEIAKQAASV